MVGEPGAGKSTLVRKLTARLGEDHRTRPFAHVLYTHPGEAQVVAAQIGGPHEQFPGTDRLSMSVQPEAIAWLSGAPAPMVFAEGDRLATVGFLNAMDEWCEKWWLFHLVVPAEVAAARRAARGSKQNDQWVKGRQTKVRRLVEHYADHVVAVHGDGADTADILKGHPAFRWVNGATP